GTHPERNAPRHPRPPRGPLAARRRLDAGLAGAWLRLRQRTAGTAPPPAALLHRCAPAELGGLPAGGGGRRLAGAAFPAARSRALVAARTRPVVAAGHAGHGLPPERPRGPGLVRLGRAAPAERSRMGAGGPLRDRLR